MLLLLLFILLFFCCFCLCCSSSRKLQFRFLGRSTGRRRPWARPRRPWRCRQRWRSARGRGRRKSRTSCNRRSEIKLFLSLIMISLFSYWYWHSDTTDHMKTLCSYEELKFLNLTENNFSVYHLQTSANAYLHFFKLNSFSFASFSFSTITYLSKIQEFGIESFISCPVRSCSQNNYQTHSQFLNCTFSK